MWLVLAILLISDFATLSEQANRARESNRLPQAAELYREALSLRPAWAEGWWHLGTVLYDQDDYAGAAGALQKVVTLHPKNAEALVMLGLSEARLGRNEEALRHLRQGRPYVADAALRKAATYNEGVLQLAAGDFGAAQETLDGLCREGVDERELMVTLGSAVLGVPSSKTASGDGELLQRAGAAECLAAQRGHLPEARNEYQRLAGDYPTTRNVQFARGRFLLANHYDEEAVEAFRLELQNSPQHLLARLGIAAILERSDPAAGLPYAEAAVRLYPKAAEAHYLLGLLLLDTEQTPGAIGELERAQRATPNDARIYFALGKAYAKAHREPEAARARADFARLSRQMETN